MDNKKFKKSSRLLECSHCDYTTVRQSQYDRHMLTSKHKRITLDNESDNDLVQNHFQCQCGKTYNYLSGLCKHKKKCKGTEDTETYQSLDKPDDSNLIIQLIKQNQEFKELLIEQNTKLVDTFSEAITQAIKHNSITNNNNINQVNSHNKTFNLNVFLNEDCKDAMNISDFVDSIKFQLADLEHMGRVGYVEGLSNIIIKNMNALDVTKRPLHCTDEKRETLYIKDGGVWTKEDEDNKNVRKLIKKVAFRNSKTLSLFKEKYPDCITSESKYSDTYSKIVIESMGGGSKCNDYDSENKIIRKIAKEMTIDKNNL
jgi:hypothetical protein